MSYHTAEELDRMGFKSLGRSVKLSTKASIYNPGKIEIGDYTRIDDFCVLSAGSGGIRIGRNVHIAVFCSLIGEAEISLEDFANLSSRVSIYSNNDDYSGEHMTNPTVPREFTNVTSRPVRLGRHVIVGAGSVVLPGSILEDGVAVGALSLVRGTCQTFSVYAGVPAKRLRARKRGLLELERRFLQGRNE